MHRRVLSTRSLNSYWLATIAIIYNTNISYAYDTMRACLSLLYLGLFQPVERLLAMSTWMAVVRWHLHR